MAAPVEKVNIVTGIFYDFETGGTDCRRCGATQVSLQAVRFDTFEVMDTFDSYILPYCKKNIDNLSKRKVLKSKYDDEEELMDYEDAALTYSHITMEMLRSQGRPLEDVCRGICDFIAKNTFPVVASNKPIMIGQNPLFDKGFMQQIMVYTGLWKEYIKLVRGSKDFWGNFQPDQLDTIHLAQLACNNDKSITTWRLESLAERFGIDLDDAHNSDADTTACREITRVLTARMRDTSSGGSNAVGGLSVEKKEKLRDHFKI